MNELDPQIQQAMSLLKERATLCNSEEEATEKARDNPIQHSQESQQILDEAVLHHTGSRLASFYLPADLVDRLDALAEQGLDPTPLLKAAIENTLNVVEWMLTQQKAASSTPPPLKKTAR